MEKLRRLEKELKTYQKVAIAYSGGCDSHFLYSYACNVLGRDNVLAILCLGKMMSDEDKNSATELLKEGQYEIVDFDVFKIEAFKNNRKDRCYHCKKALMTKVKEVAISHGYHYVVDGMNYDDFHVYRPGRKAVKELGIFSPLKEMTKAEIRAYSKQLGIVTYNKPANACLATRFPYDTLLNKEKLNLVAKGEALFHQIGINNVRLRVHGCLVRIEVEPSNFNLIITNQELISELKKLGYKNITLDLQGIKSGSFD